ncbi:MAG: prepilin peptidase [Pirellulales bacterium]|nr:prepilin peptidase [Pirellulales bacterium]
MLATVVLLGLVLVAAGTDLRRHKIYNWTTYPGILVALGLNAVGEVLLVTTDMDSTRLRTTLGYIGFWQSALGLLACGLLMLVCFVLFKVGGGDVKLIAMLGAFLGPEDGIETMLWTFVLGGCMGLIVLIWRVGAVRVTARAFRQLVYTLRLGRWSPLTDEERSQLQPPLFLAPCAVAAVVIVRFRLLDALM